MTQTRIEGGYFIVARQIFNSVAMDWNPVWFKLWIWLIGKANHAEIREGGCVYHRGEVLTSYREMAMVASYKVGFRLVKPSKDVLRRFCDALMKLHMATTMKTTRGFRIKIDRYDYFQSPQNYEDTNDDYNKTPIRHQGAHTINKNDKNEKNEKNTPLPPFGGWYVTLFNSLFNTNHQMTDGRTQKLRLRLKKFSREQICSALQNLSRSDFHRGNNDKGWRADPDFLLRNDEMIDKWLNAGISAKVIHISRIDQILGKE